MNKKKKKEREEEEDRKRTQTAFTSYKELQPTVAVFLAHVPKVQFSPKPVNTWRLLLPMKLMELQQHLHVLLTGNRKKDFLMKLMELQ